MRVESTNKKGEIAPFCVPEPTLRKALSCFNVPKTLDLRLLVNKMHEPQRREKSMCKQLSVETSVCTEHQRRLEECQRALEIWNEHRAEVCQSRLSGTEAGEELLRLQAKYARA
jgi:hypothetical protein